MKKKRLLSPPVMTLNYLFLTEKYDGCRALLRCFKEMVHCLNLLLSWKGCEVFYQIHKF